MSLSETDANLSGWIAGLVLLTGTVSVAGLADYLLTNAGYATLGSVVWGICYLTALGVVWIVWLRDIEFTGPESG